MAKILLPKIDLNKDFTVIILLALLGIFLHNALHTGYSSDVTAKLWEYVYGTNGALLLALNVGPKNPPTPPPAISGE